MTATALDYSWSSAEELQSKLSVALRERHPGYVTQLFARLDGDTVVLTGEVASEECRGDAKRFALAFDGVFKVRNEIIVAGFLEAASGSDGKDYFGQGPARADGDGGSYRTKSLGDPIADGRRGADVDRPDRQAVAKEVEVTRRPVVELTGELGPDRWVELAIDLMAELGPDDAVVSLGSFPSDWDTITVSVQLIAPWASEVEALSPDIIVTPAGPPDPARFRLLIAPSFQSGTPATVHLAFMHGTRVCGHHSLDLAGVGGAAPPVRDRPQLAGVSAPATVRLTPDAAGPSVTVTIFGDGESGQQWMWRAAVPGATTQGTGAMSIDGSHKEFAESLLKACPDMKPGEFRRAMRGVGEQLWRASPLEFQAAYLALRETLPPGFAIQIVTDEPHVPWEMMRPVADGLAADHLFIDHPVSRWPLRRASRMRSRIPGGDVLSFVPSYPDHKALASAQAEGEWVVAKLGGKRMPPTRGAFLDVLDGNSDAAVGLIHFAGHGQADTGKLDGGIEFEDGVVGVHEVDNSGIVLGSRDGTLIVLNACEASFGGKLLGMNTGWGATIAAREFGGLIAPLWEVHDGPAFEMIRAALPPLLEDGVTLGEAARRARQSHVETSIAAFAYLAHGDVMARYVRS